MTPTSSSGTDTLSPAKHPQVRYTVEEGPRTIIRVGRGSANLHRLKKRGADGVADAEIEVLGKKVVFTAKDFML